MTAPGPFCNTSGPVPSHACNCMYGTQDPRCCIARARRRELEEAHRLGREGKPLPPVPEPPATDWLSALTGIAEERTL